MVSWGVAFGKGLRIFLWSIAWGVVGGLVALAITWGILTNPSSIATNPEAFILVLFLAIVVSTLVASIGIFASIFKVTVEGTIELTGGPSISHPVNLTETETEPSTAVTA